MASRSIFSDYIVSDTPQEHSTYVHPFILKSLLEFSKEMHVMGLWKTLVNNAVIIVELKGHDKAIYVHCLSQKNEDSVLFFDGAKKYAKFVVQLNQNKISFNKLPMIGMIQFTERGILEKRDRDILSYLSVSCKGKGAYPFIRTVLNGELVFPSADECLLMARSCECAMRMFTYLYTDNMRKMYERNLVMYQSYNEEMDEYEWKMARINQQYKET